MAWPWGSRKLDLVSTATFFAERGLSEELSSAPDAERGLSEELSSAPDSLVVLRTGAFLFEPFWKTVENLMMYSPAPYSQ